MNHYKAPELSPNYTYWISEFFDNWAYKVDGEITTAIDSNIRVVHRHYRLKGFHYAHKRPTPFYESKWVEVGSVKLRIEKNTTKKQLIYYYKKESAKFKFNTNEEVFDSEEI